jgi:ParB family chromosome partitioning protein
MAAGRRTSLAALATVPVEAVPGHAAQILERLRPSQIAATPLNSRTNFGSSEELAELGESMRVRQLQPVVVVGRTDYLRLWPEHEEGIGPADYVLVNGERRWRAATQVSLPAIDVLIRPQLADSRVDVLDALFAENIDRKNLDPIEEARAVDEMVTECGSAAKAAARFRRTESWVSQRRALLRLTPELQDRVRSGELPVRIARSIAALPADGQEAAWREAREAEQARRVDRREARAQETGGTSGPQPGQDGAAGEPGEDGTQNGDFTAVKTGSIMSGHDPEPGAADGGRAGSFTAVKDPGPAAGGTALGAGAERGPRGGRARPDASVMRWDDLGKVAEAIRSALGAEDRRQLAGMILDD